MKDVLDTLDKLVVGGVRGKGYKGLDLMQIQEAVGDALKNATNVARSWMLSSPTSSVSAPLPGWKKGWRG